MNTKILVVDDEVKLLSVIHDYLSKEGFIVYTASFGAEALKLFDTTNPDFVILDLMIPDIEGEDICRIIREKSNVPILMLTAKSEVEDKIKGLSLGADDYLTKPFSVRELVVRVKTILRRTNSHKITRHIMSFSNGDLEIDTDSHLLLKSGKQVSVTPNEYKILLTLAENAGHVFSRSRLINTAMGFDFIGYDRTIDSHIKNIRQKIEDDPKNPKYIQTVYGIGYKFIGENTHDKNN